MSRDYKNFIIEQAILALESFLKTKETNFLNHFKNVVVENNLNEVDVFTAVLNTYVTAENEPQEILLEDNFVIKEEEEEKKGGTKPLYTLYSPLVNGKTFEFIRTMNDYINRAKNGTSVNHDLFTPKVLKERQKLVDSYVGKVVRYTGNYKSVKNELGIVLDVTGQKTKEDKQYTKVAPRIFRLSNGKPTNWTDGTFEIVSDDFKVFIQENAGKYRKR
jgi:hypothetical protein